jgi:hypothetical protein
MTSVLSSFLSSLTHLCDATVTNGYNNTLLKHRGRHFMNEKCGQGIARARDTHLIIYNVRCFLQDAN